MNSGYADYCAALSIAGEGGCIDASIQLMDTQLCLWTVAAKCSTTLMIALHDPVACSHLLYRGWRRYSRTSVAWQ